MTVRTHASESADSRNDSADEDEMPRRRVSEPTLERSAENDADAVLEVRDGARVGRVDTRQAEHRRSDLLRHFPLGGHMGERHFAALGMAAANHADVDLATESEKEWARQVEAQHPDRRRGLEYQYRFLGEVRGRNAAGRHIPDEHPAGAELDPINEPQPSSIVRSERQDAKVQPAPLVPFKLESRGPKEDPRRPDLGG